MRRMFQIATPAVMFTLLLVGCSGKEDLGERKYAKKEDKSKRDDSGKTVDVSKGLEPIKGSGLATLKGTIKLVGDMPDTEAMTAKLLAEIDKVTADRPVCLAGSPGEKSQFSWVVDKESRGVNNVFVWMRPEDPKTQFFDVAEMVSQQKGFDKTKDIDQPHCAFMPHALILFQRYVDPKKPSLKFDLPTTEEGAPPSTGQVFFVKNSGPLAHNTSTSGDRSRMTLLNLAVPAKGQIEVKGIQPSYNSAVMIKCSVHPWMQSWLWSFDHPFACVSGSKVGGKELGFGEYRIENIPAGVKLRVVAWHEEAAWLNGGVKGEEITLKEGENTKDFTISVIKK